MEDEGRRLWKAKDRGRRLEDEGNNETQTTCYGNE